MLVDRGVLLPAGEKWLVCIYDFANAPFGYLELGRPALTFPVSVITC